MTEDPIPDATSPRASTLITALKALGVSHLVGLPDNSSAALFAASTRDPQIAPLTVTREGECFAIAAGLWVGGRTPVVAIQNTGLLESGDSLRGTAIRMGVPLLCLITYRGHASLHAQSVQVAAGPPSRDLLVHPHVDSAAVVTEPTLDAWGVPYERYETDQHVTRLRDGWGRAQREQRPVALLLTATLS